MKVRHLMKIQNVDRRNFLCDKRWGKRFDRAQIGGFGEAAYVTMHIVK